MKVENILSPDKLDCDDSVQRHLDVRDLSGRLLEKEPKKAPQCRLVCYDHVVVGPVKFRKEGCEASTNVEIGFPSRISERQLVFAAVMELLWVCGLKFIIGEVVVETRVELI